MRRGEERRGEKRRGAVRGREERRGGAVWMYGVRLCWSVTLRKCSSFFPLSSFFFRFSYTGATFFMSKTAGNSIF